MDVDGSDPAARSQTSLDSGRGTLKTSDTSSQKAGLQTENDVKHLASTVTGLSDTGISANWQDEQTRRDSKDPTLLVEKLANVSPSIRLQAVGKINEIACSDERSERLLVILVARTLDTDASVRLKSHQALEALSLVKEMRNIYELREKLRTAQERIEGRGLLDLTRTQGCEDVLANINLMYEDGCELEGDVSAGLMHKDVCEDEVDVPATPSRLLDARNQNPCVFDNERQIPPCLLSVCLSVRCTYIY
jgi:hypothetical protein